MTSNPTCVSEQLENSLGGKVLKNVKECFLLALKGKELNVDAPFLCKMLTFF